MRKKKWLAALLLLALLCGAVSARAAEGGEFFDRSVLAGKRIGVQTGSVHARRAPEYFEDPEIYYFDSVTTAVAALTSGKLDAIVEDGLPLQYAASQLSGYRVEAINEPRAPVGFAAAKTEQGAALIAELNAFIGKMQSSGELEALRK